MGASTIGIDPGMHGAIAFLADDGSLIDVVDMPIFGVTKKVSGKLRTKNHINVHDLGDVLRPHAGAEGVIEQVGARPDDGSSQAFQFGFAVGTVHGALGALGTSMDTVTPGKWKKHFGLTADKEQARQLATRRFPSRADLFRRKMDAGRAEAALIALYHHETRRAHAAADVEL